MSRSPDSVGPVCRSRSVSTRRTAALLSCVVAIGLSIAALWVHVAGAGQSPPSSLSSVWLSPSRITADGGSDPYPVIVAGAGGQFHVLWDHLTSGGGSEVVATRGSGLSWTSPVTASLYPWAWRPALAADGAGGIHAVWSEPLEGGTENIAHATWNGATWSVERVNTAAYPSRDPTIAVDLLGRLHVAWVQQTDFTNSTSYILWSRKDGPGWSSPITVSVDLATTEAPKLVADAGGNVHLVWQSSSDNSTGVYYTRYPAGASWSPPELISTGGSAISWQPAIAVDATGTVHVVWEEYSSAQLLYRRKPSGGAWSTAVTVPATDDPRHPALVALGSGEIGVAWEHWSTEGAMDGADDIDIYFTRGNGSSWSAPVDVSQSPQTPSRNPALALDASLALHLVWAEDLGPDSTAIAYSSSRSLPLPIKTYVPLALRGQ